MTLCLGLETHPIQLRSVVIGPETTVKWYEVNHSHEGLYSWSSA